MAIFSLKNIFITATVAVGIGSAVAYAGGAAGWAILGEGAANAASTMANGVGYAGDAISWAGHGVGDLVPATFG